MLLVLSTPLFVAAFGLWGKVLLNHMGGGVMPFMSLADLADTLGLDAIAPPCPWMAGLAHAAGSLDAGTVALAAAVGCLLVDLAAGRQRY